jgi:hypothetical protein
MARAALAFASTPRHDERLGVAISAIEAGRVDDAEDAIATLDAAERRVATQFLERLALRRGLPADAIARLAEHAPDTDAGTGFAWAEGHGVRRSGVAAVRQACAAGRFDDAVAAAGTIGRLDKQARALALAVIGVATGDASRLSAAVSAATVPPQIQDGGEESEALGGVVAELAAGGVAADHPAVAAAVKALRRLGKTYKRKDVRSYGLRTAGVAAAARAARDRDDAWLAHAEALIPSIHTSTLVWPVQLEVALAHRAAGRSVEEAAALQLLPDAAWVDPAARGLYPDRADALRAYWAEATPVGAARLLAAAGADVGSRIDAAIAYADGWYHGLEKLYGDLLLFAPDRAAEVLERARDRPLAMALAAARLHPAPRARELLAAAVDAGHAPDGLDVLQAHPDLLRRAEPLAAADAGKRRWLLTDYAEAWIRLDRWDDAARCIQLAIAAPPRDDHPVWTPYYRSGNRSDWSPLETAPQPPPLAVPFDQALAAALAGPRTHHLVALAELARQLTSPAELAVVRKKMEKAPGGQGDAAAAKRAKLAAVDLSRGDVDSAIAEAQAMRDCRISGVGPSYTADAIGRWFDAHPTEVTVDRAVNVLLAIGNPAPQDMPGPLRRVLSVVLTHLPQADHRPVIDAAEAVMAKVRFKGDHAVVDLGVGVALARSGRPGAAARLDAGIARWLGGDTLYVGMTLVVRAILEAGDLPGRDERLDRVIRPMGSGFTRVAELERLNRYLWLAGDQDTLPRLHRSGVLHEVWAELRRSLVVDAPLYAPRPVDAVIAAWSTEPPNPDQAKEQLLALAAALAREGRDPEPLRVMAG